MYEFVNNDTDVQNLSNSTYCQNALAARLIMTETQSYIVGVAVAIVAVPTLVVNGLLLLAIMKTKSKAACNMHIIITTLNGCLSSLTAFPMYIVLFTFYHDERQCFLETISIFFVQIETHVLAYSILALAIDRYFSVRPDFGWSKSVAQWTQSRAGSVLIALTILILSLLHGLVTVDFFVVVKSTIGRIIMMLFNGIIGIGVYAAYLKLYCEIAVHKSSVWRILRASRAQGVTDRPNNETPVYLREFIKTITILLVAGIVCYIPFIIMDSWTGWYTFRLKTGAPQEVRFAYYMSIIPVFAYSPVNASLFIYRNTKIRQLFHAKLKSISMVKKRNRVQCLSMKRFNELGFLELMGHKANSDSPLHSVPFRTGYTNTQKGRGDLLSSELKPKKKFYPDNSDSQ